MPMRFDQKAIVLVAQILLVVSGCAIVDTRQLMINLSIMVQYFDKPADGFDYVLPVDVS
jgi:hypothetical protein